MHHGWYMVDSWEGDLPKRCLVLQIGEFFSTILKTKSFFKLDKCRNLFEVPLIISSGENIRNITRETIQAFPVSYHKEGQTRIIVQVELSNDAEVIIAKGTYRFLILIYTIRQFLTHEKCCETKQLFIKILLLCYHDQ